jgi:plastocyanin
MLRTTLLALAALVATALLALPSLAASNAQTVRVTETNYRIALSAKPRAGAVRFVVRNASDDGHDFWLKGGGKTWRTRGLAEGGSASVTATLKRGVRYQYWCAVGSHAQKGMRGSFVAR